MIGWTFGSDNMEQLLEASDRLDEPTSLILRQFTPVDSKLPFPKNPNKFIPLKKIASAYYDGNPDSDLIFMSAAKTKAYYSTCAETGKPVEPPVDYLFVEPWKIVKDLEKTIATQ